MNNDDRIFVVEYLPERGSYCLTSHLDGETFTFGTFDNEDVASLFDDLMDDILVERRI